MSSMFKKNMKNCVTVQQVCALLHWLGPGQCKNFSVCQEGGSNSLYGQKESLVHSMEGSTRLQILEHEALMAKIRHRNEQQEAESILF